MPMPVVLFVKLKEYKMHIPALFEITDRKIIENFIKETGLATLVSKGSASPVATHIPLELETNEKGDKVLWGHISKANPQLEEFQNKENVLAIFLSPVHHYISSSWYNHPNAPTWNYLSVQVSGRIKIIEGDKLWESVRLLTNRYEKNMKHPVSLDTLPPSVQKQMNGIVGFEISMDKVECAFKLSQNRNQEDFANILKQLRLSKELSAQLMADVMERERGTL
jgi:transcriptional regulator